MNKLKKGMAKMSEEVKQLGKKFPLTLFIIFCVTILCTIAIDQDFSKSTDEMLEKIYLFGAIWAVGTIFAEVWLLKKTNRIIGYGITGLISFIFVHTLTKNPSLSVEKMEMIGRFLATYVLTLGLLSMYQSMKKQNLTLEQYFLKIFRDLFNFTTTYIILNIGFVILTSIFVQLILDGHYGSIMERIFALLFGLFYVPAMVYTFSGISKKEINSFIKGLVLYVLLPLTLIAMAIIYLYIAKILILKDMPQNTIYRILASIFIVAFPIWNMAKNYTQNKKILQKIVTSLPYLYAPFLLLEMYSIGTRIQGFGITPMRYISCLFIIFQVIVLVLTIYRKSEKISHIFIYAIGLSVIILISPWHYENVSNWSQKAILEKNMTPNTTFESLSTKEKDKVKSAYEYLKYSPNGKKYIPSNWSEEEKAKIEEYHNEKRRNYDYPDYISLSCKLEADIQAYRKITYVKGRNDNDIYATIKLEPDNRTIDLNTKIQEIIRQNQIDERQVEEEFRKNPIVPISDTEDFYISRIYFSYYKTTQKFNYLDIEGYILEK